MISPDLDGVFMFATDELPMCCDCCIDCVTVAHWWGEYGATYLGFEFYEVVFHGEGTPHAACLMSE